MYSGGNETIKSDSEYCLRKEELWEKLFIRRGSEL